MGFYSTFAERRKARKKRKQQRVNKNRVKYLPKDGHGIIHVRMKEGTNA